MTAPALGKDLLGLENLTSEQILLILDTAEPFKEVSERAIKKVPALRGKTIVNLFFEASTRTRISFEFAEKRLSADTVNVVAQGSSVQKGENLVDTARNLEAMRIDMVVMRHPSSGAARFLAERIRSNVINGGDGRSASAATSHTAEWPEATSGGSPSWGPRWRCADRVASSRVASSSSA